MNAVPVPQFALHHTGLLVRDVEQAATHYARTMGYVIESAAIEDPVQTAWVKFLRLPGARNWLELVAPNGPKSRLTAALAKGGGVHHVCYEVADIAGAVAQFRESGFMVLSEPVDAVAFPGRRIAWVMDRQRFLVELLEAGPGVLSLSSLENNQYEFSQPTSPADDFPRGVRSTEPPTDSRAQPGHAA